MTKNSSIKRIVTTGILFVILLNQAMAQSNYLAQRISVSQTNVTVPEVLDEITRLHGVKFSYSSGLIDQNKRVTVEEEDVTIAEILDNITSENLDYKVVGHHIVLLAGEKATDRKKDVQRIRLTGRIIDATTHKEIENVSVYEVGNRASALTDPKGYYSLLLPSDDLQAAVNYTKSNYQDTIVFCKAKDHLEINLALKPKSRPVHSFDSLRVDIPSPNSMAENDLVKAFVPPEAIIHAENIRVIEKRPAQVSFLPYLGSNAKVSGTVTNNFSLNLIAGFTGAVNGVEIGGVLNITRRHVNGMQLGGFGNITGDNMRGVQLAGFFNMNPGNVLGLQIAGFTNMVRDTVSGVQIAGFLNTGKGIVHGLQIAGFSNFVWGQSMGVQIAGFNNFLRDGMAGLQLAGFNNLSMEDAKGVQIAGFLNIAKKDLNVAQVAGFGNYTAGTNRGIQLAGAFNFADTLKGIQLGLINVSDTSSGFSFGLIQHVRKGYRSISLSGNDVLPVNLTYRSGIDAFYNIYTIGANPVSGYPWGVGLGFGSRHSIGSRLGLALELTSRQINEFELWDKQLNLLNSFDLMLQYRFYKNMCLTAGPVLQVHVSSLKDEETGAFISSIADKPFYEYTSEPTRVQAWVGWHVGLQF